MCAFTAHRNATIVSAYVVLLCKRTQQSAEFCVCCLCCTYDTRMQTRKNWLQLCACSTSNIGTDKKMGLFSNIHSYQQNQPTWPAVIEISLAFFVYFWLVPQYLTNGSYWHIWLAVIIAPFFLLRAPQSVDLSLRLYARYNNAIVWMTLVALAVFWQPWVEFFQRLAKASEKQASALILFLT